MFEKQTCGTCGKEFHPRAREIYVYKRHVGKRETLFCSYSCMCEFDKAHEQKKLKSREKLKAKKKKTQPAKTKAPAKQKKGRPTDEAAMQDAIGLYACAWLRYRDAINK
jgi:hypothetical protein